MADQLMSDPATEVLRDLSAVVQTLIFHRNDDPALLLHDDGPLMRAASKAIADYRALLDAQPVEGETPRRRMICVDHGEVECVLCDRINASRWRRETLAQPVESKAAQPVAVDVLRAAREGR
jgi:hypothetical protein